MDHNESEHLNQTYDLLHDVQMPKSLGYQLPWIYNDVTHNVLMDKVGQLWEHYKYYNTLDTDM